MKKSISFIILIITFLSSFSVCAASDTVAKETFYPNDPLLEKQWYYEAVKGYAFRNNNVTGRGVKVGIIDTGLTKEFKTFYDFDGVDIQTGVNVAAYMLQQYPEFANENRIDCTEDDDSHGTAVASVICAKADNNYGIAGLVDGCTIVPYKIKDSYFGDRGVGAGLLKAIEFAYQDGCDVVNISWGAKGVGSTNENLLINKYIQNGMIIVAAAGNRALENNELEFPAACDNVIGVGGVRATYPFTEISDVRNASENSYERDFLTASANKSVFCSAPCVRILLANTVDGEDDFCEQRGTSFASPIVASAAIGVKQMRPYVDTDMFKEILKATAVDLEDEGYDINTGYGMVNFEKIYEYVSEMPLTAPERTPEVTVDYENEQLVGFPINREYTINGEAVILNDDFSLPIKEEWFGTTIEIVKKASSESYEDSLPQLLDIPAREVTQTPTAEIDYLNERILGLESGKKYTVNGEDVTITTFVYPTVGTGFEIKEEWFGTTIEIICKAPNGQSLDSEPQILDIPVRPAVTGLSGDKSMIIGTTANMQYRKQGTTTWRNCSDGSTRVSFSSGTAEVYIKATDTAFKSDITTIQVGAVATPEPEPTTAPTAIPEATATPTIAPTVEPTANPTIEPTEAPVFSFLPTIDYENKRIIGLDSTQEYTVNGRDISLFTYSTGETGFDIDELWYGETITLAVKGTNEVRQITVQFTEKEQYELETAIEYKDGICTYSAVNNTIWTINATGIIAVYAQNGVLRHLETVGIFPIDGINKELDFALSDGDTVKWLVWDSLEGMKPIDKVKLSYIHITKENQ